MKLYEGNRQIEELLGRLESGSREALTQAVLDKYDEALSQTQDEGIEIQDLPEDEEDELEEPEPEPEMSM